MMLLTLDPKYTFALTHRVGPADAAPRQGLVVVAAAEGAVTVVDVGKGTVNEFRRPSGVTSVAIHPSRPRVAVAGRGGLALLERDGTVIWEFWGETLEDDGGGACYFAPSGEFVWCAAPGDEVIVQARASENGRLLAQTAVEDPFGESALSFHPTPDPATVALWLAAGQDGQEVVWLTRQGNQITARREPNVENQTPPVFAPLGHEFLTATSEAVFRYSYPAGTLLGECPRPWGDEEELFTEVVAWPTARQALVSSLNGRLFVLNTATMQLTAEVAVTGYEPRPAEEMYPTLKGDLGLCTLLAFHSTVSGLMVTSARRDGGAGLEGWQDKLLCLLLDSLVL